MKKTLSVIALLLLCNINYSSNIHDEKVPNDSNKKVLPVSISDNYARTSSFFKKTDNDDVVIKSQFSICEFNCNLRYTKNGSQWRSCMKTCN